LEHVQSEVDISGKPGRIRFAVRLFQKCWTRITVGRNLFWYPSEISRGLKSLEMNHHWWCWTFGLTVQSTKSSVKNSKITKV